MSHRIRYTDGFKQDAVAQVVARGCAPRVNLRVGQMDKQTSYLGLSATLLFAFWSFGSGLHREYAGLSDNLFFIFLTLPLVVFGVPLIKKRKEDEE